MENTIERGEEVDRFLSMVRSSREPLEKYVRSLDADSARSQDILQECYLKAFENIRGLRDSRAFLPWIKKIALRIHLRKEKGPGDEALFEEQCHGSDVFSPEALLEKGEDERAIRSSLNALKREDRRIILLFFLFGCSHRDIAERYGISVAAAKKRLERARGKLEGELGDLMRRWESPRLPSNDSLYDVNLESSFEKASWIGELSLIEAMLLDGVDVNERDMTGRTLLHYAALRGNGEAVDLLLRYGAARAVRDKAGMTAREIAFENKNYALWEKL